jgi:predicted nucleic acid-binding protein
MPGGRVFVDTNVLVYAHDRDAGQKYEIAQRILLELWDRRSGVLSIQVMQEFYVIATRKILHPLPAAKVIRILKDYCAWPIEVNNPLSIFKACGIEEKYKISFWDALIVAAASNAGAEKILTEDLQPGQIIEGLKIENPFSRLPGP